MGIQIEITLEAWMTGRVRLHSVLFERKLNNLVSQKQRCVALSSCEAEYMADTAAGTQGIWLLNLMKQIVDVPPGPVEI